MKSYSQIYALFLMFAFCASCRGQVKTELPKDSIKFEPANVITSSGPNRITRNSLFETLFSRQQLTKYSPMSISLNIF